MNNKKKMEYALDITRRIPISEAIRDGKTEKEAIELKGTWIKLNPELFAFVEDTQTTIVEITEDNRGCGCKWFADSTISLMCKHLVLFADLKETPQLLISSDEKICRVLTEYLFSLGWYIEDRWLYPSLDSPTRLDPANADHELDIGVEPTNELPKTTKSVEMVHYKCPKCGEEVDIEEDKLQDWKLNHTFDGCKGNPASEKKATSDPDGDSREGADPTPNTPPTRAPVPNPGMRSTKCEWCGEKIERELAADLAQALDEHKKICPKQPEAIVGDEGIEGYYTNQAARESMETEDVGIPVEPGSIINIAKAMCNMQKANLSAKADSINKFHGNAKYADLSSVWDAIRKPLSDNGLSVIQGTESYEGGITVVTYILHTSGEMWVNKLSAKVPDKLPDKNGQAQSNIQSLGATITYLRRFSLTTLLGVCPDDDDGETAMGRGKM